jgi:hypothetical protein
VRDPKTGMWVARQTQSPLPTPVASAPPSPRAAVIARTTSNPTACNPRPICESEPGNDRREADTTNTGPSIMDLPSSSSASQMPPLTLQPSLALKPSLARQSTREFVRSLPVYPYNPSTTSSVGGGAVSSPLLPVFPEDNYKVLLMDVLFKPHQPHTHIKHDHTAGYFYVLELHRAGLPAHSPQAPAGESEAAEDGESGESDDFSMFYRAEPHTLPITTTSPNDTSGGEAGEGMQHGFRVFVHHGAVADLDDGVEGEGSVGRECRYFATLQEAKRVFAYLHAAQVATPSFVTLIPLVFLSLPPPPPRSVSAIARSH